MPPDERLFEIGKYYLSKRPNSDKWCATWFDPGTRQTRRESLRTSDIEDAKLALARWVTLNADRDREHPRDVPLGEVFVRYFSKHGRHARSAVSVQRNLAIVLEALPENIAVSELTLERQADAVRKLKAKGFAPGTIKRAMGAAKAAVNFAWKNGELDRPIPFASLPEGQPREKVMTVEELAALWDADMPAHMRVFLALLIGTAGRPEAILQLTRSQCDTERGFVNLNTPGRVQTKKRRPILPIPDFLLPWIQTTEDGPLVSWRGKPVVKINKTWRTVRESVGLGPDVVPYAIRHTVATELRARGVPELELAGFLGHSMPNFRTTGRYAHVAPDHLGHAKAAVDDLVNDIAAIAQVPLKPTLRASSVLAEKKRDGLTPSNTLIFLKKTGAGDEIRTHDPNLGKVVLYP